MNVFFGAGGLPSLNMANVSRSNIHTFTVGDPARANWHLHTSSNKQTCNPSDDSNFPGTELPNCQFLASSIKACQAKGKIITLSLGGATGAASFSSASQASAFGDTIWNLFLGGSSSTRPFGDAVGVRWRYPVMSTILWLLATSRTSDSFPFSVSFRV